MDPTTLIEIPPSEPSEPSEPGAPAPRPGRPRRSRRVTALVAAAIAATCLLAGGIAVLATGDGTDTRLDATTTSTTVGGASTSSTVTDDTTNGGAGPQASGGDTGATGTTGTGAGTGGDVDDDGVTGDDSTGVPDDDTPPDPQPQPQPPADDSGDPADLEPTGDPQPASLCDTPPADGASLIVGPDPLVLPAGTLSGVLIVANCAPGAVDWSTSSAPSVTLAAGGETPAGETTELGFTIDADAWEPGAIEVTVKVAETGHVHEVTVHAFRPTLGKDLVAGNGGFTAGSTAGGCANQCITKAAVKAAMSTPDIQLDIATTVDAFVKVWVSTQPPIVVNKVPSFPGVAPIAASAGKVRSWLAPLSPLQAGTKYYVIVRAADANGKVSYRSGSFRTVTPAQSGDLVVPGGAPGCKVQCITKATFTPGPDPTSKHMEMRTNVPTTMQVAISTEVPHDLNGRPAFDHPAVFLASGEQFIGTWSADLGPLELGREYHVIVTAIDAKGRIDSRTGTFRTPPKPVYDVWFEVLDIDVIDDNDKIGRGELSFAWSVGDEHVGARGEQKLNDGDHTSFGRNTSIHVVKGMTGFLPTVYVTGYERDADGLVEFCSMGGGTMSDPGSNGDCDITWNTASTGIVDVAGISSLAPCTDFGVDPLVAAGRGCMLLETPDSAVGPEFRVLLAMSSAAA